MCLYGQNRWKRCRRYILICQEWKRSKLIRYSPPIGDSTSQEEVIASQYIGNIKKRREVGQEKEGVWAGTVVMTTEGKVIFCVCEKNMEENRGDNRLDR